MADAKVRVTFTIILDPADADPNDATGMTEEAFVSLNEDLMQLGADDIEVDRIDD